MYTPQCARRDNNGGSYLLCCNQWWRMHDSTHTHSHGHLSTDTCLYDVASYAVVAELQSLSCIPAITSAVMQRCLQSYLFHTCIHVCLLTAEPPRKALWWPQRTSHVARWTRPGKQSCHTAKLWAANKPAVSFPVSLTVWVQNPPATYCILKSDLQPNQVCRTPVNMQPTLCGCVETCHVNVSTFWNFPDTTSPRLFGRLLTNFGKRWNILPLHCRGLAAALVMWLAPIQRMYFRCCGWLLIIRRSYQRFRWVNRRSTRLSSWSIEAWK